MHLRQGSLQALQFDAFPIWCTYSASDLLSATLRSNSAPGAGLLIGQAGQVDGLRTYIDISATISATIEHHCYTEPGAGLLVGQALQFEDLGICNHVSATTGRHCYTVPGAGLLVGQALQCDGFLQPQVAAVLLRRKWQGMSPSKKAGDRKGEKADEVAAVVAISGCTAARRMPAAAEGDMQLSDVQHTCT